MSIFEYVTGTMMLIVGLGITRLLSALVDRFRDRDINKPHWIPLAWALPVLAFMHINHINNALAIFAYRIVYKTEEI